MGRTSRMGSTSTRPSARKAGSTRGEPTSQATLRLRGVVRFVTATVEQLAQLAGLERLPQAVDRGHDLPLRRLLPPFEAARRAHQILPARGLRGGPGLAGQ